MLHHVPALLPGVSYGEEVSKIRLDGIQVVLLRHVEDEFEESGRHKELMGRRRHEHALMRILHKARGLDVTLRHLWPEGGQDVPDQCSQQPAAKVAVGGQRGEGHGKRKLTLPFSRPLALQLPEKPLAVLCIPASELAAAGATERRRATCPRPIENLCTHLGTWWTAITATCKSAVVPESLAFTDPLKSMSDLHLGNMFPATPVPSAEMALTVTSAWDFPTQHRNMQIAHPECCRLAGRRRPSL